MKCLEKKILATLGFAKISQMWHRKYEIQKRSNNWTLSIFKPPTTWKDIVKKQARDHEKIFPSHVYDKKLCPESTEKLETQQ